MNKGLCWQLKVSESAGVAALASCSEVDVGVAVFGLETCGGTHVVERRA